MGWFARQLCRCTPGAYMCVNDASNAMLIVRAALRAGATLAGIVEVLQLCVAQGVQACSLAVPLLAEELGRRR